MSEGSNGRGYGLREVHNREHSDKVMFILERVHEDITELKCDVKDLSIKLDHIRHKELPELKTEQAVVGTKTKAIIGIAGVIAGIGGSILVMLLKFLITGTP